jgi:DNA helicase-2/ATP-dependent DNA helicase PcrA
LGTDELKGAAKNSLRRFLTDLEHWQRCLQTMPPAELAQMVLDESGYTQMWMQDKSAEAPGRLENLKELVSALDEFQSLGDFLEHVSLVMDNNSAAQSEAVSIMTLHSAKGLEFNTVFLAGWEEGIFPNARSLDAEAREGLEEERRLAYVGLTRARKRVYISFVANRRLHGLWQSSLPSRFIDELPKDLVDIHTQPGLFARRSYEEEEQRIKKPLHLSSSALSPASMPRALYQVRDRVFHLKFGYGQVVEVMGDKLEVDFEHSGLKKVMTSFVEKK